MFTGISAIKSTTERFLPFCQRRIFGLCMRVNKISEAIATGDLAKVREASERFPDAVKHPRVFYRAVDSYSIPILEYLLGQGAPVNGDVDYRPLASVVENGSERLTNYLLEKGADPSLRSREDRLPYHESLRRLALCKTPGLARLFLQRGISVDALCNGVPPLLMKEYAGKDHTDALVRFLVDNGADVNCRNKNLETPIHLYLKKLYNSGKDGGATELGVLIMLEKFREVNERDAEGLSPLHLAILKQRPGIVQRLLELGADPNQSVGNRGLHGITPLDLALFRRNGPIGSCLVKAGGVLNDTVSWSKKFGRLAGTLLLEKERGYWDKFPTI